VGAALGLAILGAVGSTLTTDAWSDRVSALPASLQTQAHRIDELVIDPRAGRTAAPVP